MQITEKTKEEIAARAEKMYDFLRMEYLENCTRKFTDKEILKYCFIELSKLYERNSIYPDAIKYLAKYEEVCTTNREKFQAHMKEIEILIKSGNYEKIEFSLKKLKEIASPKEIFETNQKIISLLKEEAFKFERMNKYSSASKAYEKLFHIVTNEERKDIKRKLIFLYNKLGKVREAIELERSLTNLP